jgi:hypothetical protein
MLSPCLTEGDLCSRDTPEAEKKHDKIFPVHSHEQTALRPCEIGSYKALVIGTRVEVAVRPPPLLL